MNRYYALRIFISALFAVFVVSATTFGAGTPAYVVDPAGQEAQKSFFDQQDPPNPNGGKITVTVVRSVESDAIKVQVRFPRDADELKVSLHNLIGSQMSVSPITSAIEGEAIFQFDTRGLPNGPYFVVLEALGQRITKKIMLSR